MFQFLGSWLDKGGSLWRDFGGRNLDGLLITAGRPQLIAQLANRCAVRRERVHRCAKVPILGFGVSLYRPDKAKQPANSAFSLPGSTAKRPVETGNAGIMPSPLLRATELKQHLEFRAAMPDPVDVVSFTAPIRLAAEDGHICAANEIGIMPGQKLGKGIRAKIRISVIRVRDIVHHWRYVRHSMGCF